MKYNIPMKFRLFSILASYIFFVAIGLGIAHAQSPSLQAEIVLNPDSATGSAEGTPAASLASPSAAVIEKVQEKKDQDITDPSGKQKSMLAQFLDDNPPQPLAWNNFMQHGIRYAVSNGVGANTIVLILLFPLIASLIAGSRHIIGLRGFGIYTPAVLSVALVSTGLFEGLIIFGAIATTAVIANHFISRLKLSYLPRTGLLLSIISLVIFGVLVLSPALNVVSLLTVNIFPILILVLLSENFLDAQSKTKQSDAIAVTAETLGLAFISGLILQWEPVQKFVLLEPELFVIGIMSLNIIIGKFVGLRISERLRFHSIIEEEE